MASSRALYTSFHRERPREAYRGNVNWPDSPVIVGKARSIVYRSDKWGDGVHDYEHKIDGDVDVICDRGARIFGALAGARKTYLLRPPSSAARLGTAVELTVEVPGGRRIKARFDKGGDLYDGPELLAIPAATGRGKLWYVIRGTPTILLRTSDMVVTPAGLDG